MGSKAVDVLMRRIDAVDGSTFDEIASPIVFDTTVVLRGSLIKASQSVKIVP